MEHLYIAKTSHTPEVFFNIDENKLCIYGRSFPEDSASFYSPVVLWLESNIQEFTKEFVLEVQLEYFNTSSSKYLLKMLRFMEKYKESHDVPISVKWNYFQGDVDMKEAGMEYQQFVSLPFDFVEIDRK